MILHRRDSQLQVDKAVLSIDLHQCRCGGCKSESSQGQESQASRSWLANSFCTSPIRSVLQG